MKYLLVPFIALGVGTAAIAATPVAATSGSYPACSKTVKDECTEVVAQPARHVAGHQHSRKVARHHHDEPVAKPS